MKKIVLLTTGDVEVTIHDSAYVAPGTLFIIPKGAPRTLFIIPEGGIVIEDPGATYKKKIAQLEYELQKAKRGKQWVVHSS